MEDVKICPRTGCKIITKAYDPNYNWMLDPKSECAFCGQYENPINDEESRLDNPENPENFYTGRFADEVEIAHYECWENR